MKNKRCLILLLLPLVVSCGGNHNSSNSAVPFTYDDSIPSINLESHIYNDDSFENFPVFENPTENLTFELSDDESYYIVSDKNYTLNNPNLVIPSSYNNLPVKKIAGEGFAYKTWLNSVYIPESIEVIGSGAFNGSGLKNVYYDAKNVEDFNARNWVFNKGSADQELNVYFGPNVEYIPSRLFYPLATNPSNVPVVKNIYFSNNSKIKAIGDYAFYLLDGYKNLHLPNSIEHIGDYAFYGSDFEEIKLPSSLSSIGSYAFAFSSLKYIDFPNTLEEIGDYAFSQCSELVQVDLSSTVVTSINNHTFHKCRTLKYVKFNDLISSIGDYAFYGNESLKAIVLTENILSVGDYAFALCSSVEGIYLNRDLTHIGKYGFYRNENVKRLVVAAKKLDDFDSSNHIFERLSKNVDDLLVVFKEGVTYIPQRMFLSTSIKEDNAKIFRVILPTSLLEIGDSAFFELSIANVDYLGTIAQFNKIDIDFYNNVLIKVVCHSGEESK